MRAPLIAALVVSACSSATQQLESLAGDGAGCTADADCCVVYSCWGSYVVGSDDFSHAKELAGDATDAGGCPKCGGPGATDVRCNPSTSRCEGRTFGIEPPASVPPAAGEAHCGPMVADPWVEETGSAVFGCGG